MQEIILYYFIAFSPFILLNLLCFSCCNYSSYIYFCTLVNVLLFSIYFATFSKKSYFAFRYGSNTENYFARIVCFFFKAIEVEWQNYLRALIFKNFNLAISLLNITTSNQFDKFCLKNTSNLDLEIYATQQISLHLSMPFKHYQQVVITFTNIQFIDRKKITVLCSRKWKQLQETIKQTLKQHGG